MLTTTNLQQVRVISHGVNEKLVAHLFGHTEKFYSQKSHSQRHAWCWKNKNYKLLP